MNSKISVEETPEGDNQQSSESRSTTSGTEDGHEFGP
jgi:hypothetical protein